MKLGEVRLLDWRTWSSIPTSETTRPKNAMRFGTAKHQAQRHQQHRSKDRIAHPTEETCRDQLSGLGGVDTNAPRGAHLDLRNQSEHGAQHHQREAS